MSQSRFSDIKWWYWFVTAILLLAYLIAGQTAAIHTAVVVGIVQLVHFAVQEDHFAAFPVQVRAAYLALLVTGLVSPLGFIHWIQFFWTWAMVLVGYCPLAQMLSLLPWNRREPLSGELVRRAFLSRPVRGSIVAR